MSPAMPVKLGSIAKALVAHIARVRPFSGVPAQMRHVTFVPHEAFVALVTPTIEWTNVQLKPLSKTFANYL